MTATSPPTIEQSALSMVLQSRLLVGYLGERAQFAWWPTAFFEVSSRLFLEPVFAKTSRLAQYHGVLEAARLVHDEHLSVGTYHLFRLPEEVEQDLHTLMQTPEGEALATRSCQSKDSALELLKTVAGNVAARTEGPIAVGSVKDFDSASTLKAIAGAYWSAFAQNAKSYPYLMA